MGVRLRYNRQIEILSIILETKIQDVLDYLDLEVYDLDFVRFYSSSFYSTKTLPIF